MTGKYRVSIIPPIAGERWKEILPNFPGYFISDHGRIIGRRGSLLMPTLNSGGYLFVGLRRFDGKGRQMRVNRLVCWYFNDPPPDDGQRYEAAHLDANKRNNHYANLEWQTRKKNANHPTTRARISIAIRESWGTRESVQQRGSDGKFR